MKAKRKARFLTDLVVVHVSDNLKRLVYPLEYESGILDCIHTVPAGLETDGGSVPRAPGVYLFFGGIADPACVVHDDLYRSGIVPRKVADEVFREALKVCGVGIIRRNLMYAAVRAFGAAFYREHEESMAP